MTIHTNAKAQKLWHTKTQCQSYLMKNATQGVQGFCRIRSYLSTLKKQGQNVLLGIQTAIENLFAQHMGG